MTFAPLTSAPLVIQVHAYSAIAAFALGAVQLAGVKGTTAHRALGYIWLGLMLVVAVSSFWINEIRLWGPFSPIHLLSIFTLTMLPLGLLHARRHNVAAHKGFMLGMFTGALVIAGIFTFAPGRIMHQVFLGG